MSDDLDDLATPGDLESARRRLVRESKGIRDVAMAASVLGPRPARIMASHAVPFGHVYREWTTNGELVLWANRGECADLSRGESSFFQGYAIGMLSPPGIYGIPVETTDADPLKPDPLAAVKSQVTAGLMTPEQARTAMTDYQFPLSHLRPSFWRRWWRRLRGRPVGLDTRKIDQGQDMGRTE